MLICTQKQVMEGKIANAQDYLEKIEKLAIGLWGNQKWRAEIARKYVELAQEQGDADATYEGRRRQIYRAFDEYSCSADTLFLLAAAVGCKFQMVRVIEEVI